MADFNSRYHQWLKQLEEHQLDGFLLTHPPNLAYLFNFTGSTAMACCLDGESFLIVDSRYIETAQTEAVNCQPILAQDSLAEKLRSIVSNKNHSKFRLGIEANHISYDLFATIKSWSKTIEYVPTHELTEKLRMIKDDKEIQNLKKAFQIAHTAYRQLTKIISPGMTESIVAGLLELELRKAGGEGLAFETIVASGKRSSLPHAQATTKQIGPQEFLLIDFGTKYFGYCSDLTRIHLMPDAHKPTIYKVVQEAQEKALALIKPGVLCAEIDQESRNWISQSGYGEYFGHSLGHGLGLEVHELPSLSSKSRMEIQEGMVFTIEPGIYIPGQYGVRIEDVVVITQNGFQFLSQPGS